MPKRGPTPIVPSAAEPRKKKKVKRTRDAGDDEAPPAALVAPPPAAAKTSSSSAKSKPAAAAAAEDEPPPRQRPRIDTTMQKLVDERSFIAPTGVEVAAQPDRSDKPHRFLAWLVGPMKAEAFLSKTYARRPLHVARADRAYYDGWFSRAEIERQLRECGLRWTHEVDAARYVDGARTTHNGEGVASAADVWARYAEGCSIRLSWPQRHSDPLWRLLSPLEELFGCMVGANAYLTPAASQGFAPHWDDIDAMVLQLEGTKRWRVYAPRTDDETWPRFSSPNLGQARSPRPSTRPFLARPRPSTRPSTPIHALPRPSMPLY